jgi:hypothetical protein
MRVVAALVLPLVCAACGARTGTLLDESSRGDAGPGDAALDAPVEDVESPEAAPACTPLAPSGGTCNDLTPSGPSVTVQCVSGTGPTPSGGTILDGTYEMVSSDFYGSPCSSDTERIVWNVCGDTWATDQVVSAGPPNLRIDGTVTVGPTTLVLETTCSSPTEPSTKFGYDATPTSLTIYTYGYGAGTVRVDRFTRQ